MNLIWVNFTDYLSLERYQQVKRHAGKAKQWPQWREKAMKHMETHLTKKKTNANRWTYDSGYSVLVDILLWEENPEAAWEAANSGGCSQSLWMRLAALREQDAPLDAVGVYQTFVAPTIEQTNNQAYEDAIKMIKKIQSLMTRLGKTQAFADYVSELRVKYKPKRNFIKLLDRIKT
jgi:hypothetical protein